MVNLLNPDGGFEGFFMKHRKLIVKINLKSQKRSLIDDILRKHFMASTIPCSLSEKGVCC